MAKTGDRFIRQKALFGDVGQKKLNARPVTIVGYGGLGTCVFEEVMHMGAAEVNVIEPEVFDRSNHGRYFGSRHDDVGKTKTEIAKRNGKLIDPDIPVNIICSHLESQKAFDVIKNSDVVFGCLDHDGPRFILNELCVAYGIPLIDIASDVPEEGVYGGRVAVVRNGNGCLDCMKVLDKTDVRRYISPNGQRENEAAIYGISVNDLTGGTGPSVMPINGVVASLAVLEYMVLVTGLREPKRLINYYGHEQKIGHSLDGSPEDCYYCKRHGIGEEADVERYICISSDFI